MITLEEFIKILGPEAKTLSETEINLLYKIHTTFADFAYKSWINERQLDVSQNKK